MTATREPLSPSTFPTARVCRLAGMTPEQLAVATHPLPPGAPVVIHHDVTTAPTSTSAVVDGLLDHLESVARDTFPSWLPGADLLAAPADHDRRVVRLLAERRSAVSAHFGPFLSAIADAALRGIPCATPFDAAMRAVGLGRILADAFGRDHVAVFVDVPADLNAAAQHLLATAFGWLVDHGRIGIWLPGTALPHVDRIGTETLTAPTEVTALQTAPVVDPPAHYPAPVGMPHPASAAEQTLERMLARCDWAAGRQWNQVRSGHPLVPLIRVDLMWPEQRCVVEIDGPDHRGALKYADDRRRDNALVLDGFAVLRFTNDEVVDDPQRVVATIETLLSTRRRKGEQP